MEQAVFKVVVFLCTVILHTVTARINGNISFILFLYTPTIGFPEIPHMSPRKTAVTAETEIKNYKIILIWGGGVANMPSSIEI